MKKIVKIVSIFCCFLLSLIFIACDGSSVDLVLSSDVVSVAPGGVVTFSAIYEDENDEKTEAKDVEYKIIDGEDYATISENVLTINSDAELGTQIKVVATNGNKISNEIKIKVSVPLEKIIASANGITNVMPGELITLIKTLNPAVSDVKPEEITWVVEEGATICNVVGDNLYVKPQAQTGKTIKVKAKSGDIESNTLTFMVGYQLTNINLIVAGSSNIPNGSSRSLITQLTPENATDVNLTWEFLEGESLCSIVNKIITINDDAEVGSLIRFRAVSGTIKSEPVTVIVGTPIETISLSPIGLSGQGSVKVTTNSSVLFQISVTPEKATSKGVQLYVTEGMEYASVNGNSIEIDPQTPYGTQIKVKAKSGTIESDNEIVLQYGIAATSVELSTLTPIITNGKIAELKAVVSPANASAKDSINYEIIDGSEYASIVGNAVEFKEGVAYGTVVKVKATCDGKESAILTVQYGVAVTSVELSTLTPIITSGKTAVLSANVLPNDATEKNNVEYIITEGSEYINKASNTIVFKDNVAYGTIVKVKAVCDGVASSEITIQYGIAVTSVQINQPSITEIVKGNSVILSATVLPENATDLSVVYQIVEGSENATIIGNVLTIKESAETGVLIKIKAISAKGSVVSVNEISFTVKATLEEEQSRKFRLALSDDKLVLDKNEGYTPVLMVDVYNLNYQKVQDKEIKYTVVQGSEFVKTTANGYSCNFEILGHGDAVVEVSIVGTDVKETVNIKAIVPPDSIMLPEVFRTEGRMGFVYSFSKIRPNTQMVETLPFVATAKGDNVCQNLRYSFIHEDGTNGSTVAEYKDGKITFNKTGKVTVLISSNSGSAVETTASYSFNINEGYNVYTFNEFQTIAGASYYKGEPVNIVVLERPDGSANNYEYGFDLVSYAGLISKEAQTFDDIYGHGGQKIIFPNRSAHVNGNKHKIDLSQVRVITKEELTANGKTEDNFWPAILSFIPWKANLAEGEKIPGTYNVKVYDLEIIGNCPIDYDGDLGIEETRKGQPIGVFYAGIVIGNRDHHAKYYVDAKNITVSQCDNGIEIAKVVGNGVFENIYAYNCYRNGIEVASSILTFNNVKFGKCGAAGIELIPPASNEAGVDFNEKQTITFKGSLDVSQNHTNGQTQYFKNYLVMGQYMIPDVIQMVLNNGNYNENQQNHMQEVDSENPYVFICFVLSDMSTMAPNYSVCNYPGYQEGGIVKATDLPKEGYDTTHQYIELDVDFGMGSFGKVLLYNHYYGK